MDITSNTVFRRIGSNCVDALAGLVPHVLLRPLASRISARLPERAHHRFVRHLMENCGEVAFNQFHDMKWTEVKLPSVAGRFEDFACLFTCCPSNRGLVRMDFDEAALLFRIVNSLPKGCRGVEIGRYNGGSTVLLCAALPAEGKLTSIDISPVDDEALLAALRSIGAEGRLDLLVTDANDVSWSDPLDFVFIDGDHSYDGAKRDHMKWGRLVKETGLIIHHDMANSRPYASQLPSLKQLRADILSCQSSDLELWEEVGSISVFRRVSANWSEF